MSGWSIFFLLILLYLFGKCPHSDQNMIKAKIHISTRSPRIPCFVYHLDLLLMVHFQESVFLAVAYLLQMVWALQKSLTGSGTSERLQRPSHSELHQRFFYCHPLTKWRHAASLLLPSLSAGAVGTPNPFHTSLDLEKGRACTWNHLSWRMAWKIGKYWKGSSYQALHVWQKSGKLCCRCKVRAALLYNGHLLLEIIFGGVPRGGVPENKYASTDSTNMNPSSKEILHLQSKMVWTMFRISEPEQSYILHLRNHLQTVIQTPRKLLYSNSKTSEAKTKLTQQDQHPKSLDQHPRSLANSSCTSIQRHPRSIPWLPVDQTKPDLLVMSAWVQIYPLQTLRMMCHYFADIKSASTRVRVHEIILRYY